MINIEPCLTPPEPRIVAECDMCHGDIYEGETRAWDGKRVYCEECVDVRWNRLTFADKCEALGLDMIGGQSDE